MHGSQARAKAAAARRAAAEQAGERGGDAAFQQYRCAVPGLTAARVVGMPSQLRAEQVTNGGKPKIHTWGYFTQYERAYPMWDDFGEYEEMTMRGSGSETLAADPDVAFLVNHRGVTMARTRARQRDATLFLKEDETGGWHDAYLNPERNDVHDLFLAISDGQITEMSFSFMIADGLGKWSKDFTTFQIFGYNLDRGDVSAVNYGANPYTDIGARAGEVLRDLDHLPRGARAEAVTRLSSRMVNVGFERKGPSESTISWRSATPMVNPKASSTTRKLQHRLATTGSRLVAYATANEIAPVDMMMIALPWFEIRAAAEPGGPNGDQEATDVLIYDEIGGSFGVNAADFAEALAEIDTPVINLRVNSPGGVVKDALGIHSSLLHHPAFIHGFVDGMAASAASVILMASDTITVMPGGEMMIHDASAMFEANPAEGRRIVDLLDRQSNHIAGMYAARAGETPEHWRALMGEETWMFGSEIIDMGLGNEMWTRPEPARDERLTRKHDITGRYRYAGRRAAPNPLQRRAYVSEHPAARPAVAALSEFAAGALTPGRPYEEPSVEDFEFPSGIPQTDSVTDQASGDQSSGRSIAYIEAVLAAEGISLD